MTNREGPQEGRVNQESFSKALRRSSMEEPQPGAGEGAKTGKGAETVPGGRRSQRQRLGRLRSQGL